MICIRRITEVFVVLSLAAVFGSPTAEASSACLTAFTTQYPDSQTEDAGFCQTCHQATGNSAFNVYGKDLSDSVDALAGGSWRWQQWKPWTLTAKETQTSLKSPPTHSPVGVLSRKAAHA